VPESVRVQGNVPRQAGTGAVGRVVVSIKPQLGIAATFVSLLSAGLEKRYRWKIKMENVHISKDGKR